MFSDPYVRVFIHHVVNGDVFYLSVVLFSLAVAAHVGRWTGTGAIAKLCVNLSMLISIILLVISAASLTILWLTYLVLLISFWTTPRRWKTASGAAACVALCFCWTTAVMYETRGAAADPQKAVVVFGDSLSVAYHVDESDTWPRRLGKLIEPPVISRATAGYKVSDVIRQVKKDMPRDATVIVAVGGNDTLGSTPVAEYARDLDLLLQMLTDAGNSILMLEAPAPPTAPWYAWAQRWVAWRRGVLLLPKRVMLSAIFGEAKSTVDDLHLSATGHQIMAQQLAERLWGKR